MAVREARQREVASAWAREAVVEGTMRNSIESRLALLRRSRRYPGMCSMLELWDGHDGEIVLDYGCGSGADLLGILLHSRTRLIIGAETGGPHLDLARRRLAVHRGLEGRYMLWDLRVSPPGLPIREAPFHFILSNGALSRAEDPLAVLREFRRLLAPGGRANVMVYNRDSVWFHLHAALAEDGGGGSASVAARVRRALTGAAAEAETALADDPALDGARLWRPRDFLGLARRAGLSGEFVGGYFSAEELACVHHDLERAFAAPGLPKESRRFLETLAFDDHGRPMHDGRYAGLGGAFRLRVR